MVKYCKTCDLSLDYGKTHDGHVVYDLDEVRKRILSTEELYREIQQELTEQIAHGRKETETKPSLYLRILIDQNLDHYGVMDHLKESLNPQYIEMYRTEIKRMNHIGLPSVLCIFYSLQFIADLVADYLLYHQEK